MWAATAKAGVRKHKTPKSGRGGVLVSKTKNCAPVLFNGTRQPMLIRTDFPAFHNETAKMPSKTGQVPHDYKYIFADIRGVAHAGTCRF
ncbi:MAG: hypothetical protein AAF761_07360, partial [Pseudomonadota bacterium]